jgi:hypothetical protein
MKASVSTLLVPDLPADAPEPPDADRAGPVALSIVLAARDEESRVRETVVRALAQERISCEVIVVDDRSTDGTSAILDTIARENPALHSARVDELPPGWLGKCNALRAGASRARGRWLLFTDADTWLEPFTAARAVRAAERAGVEHVCVIPGFARTSFWGRAALTAFAPALVGLAAMVNLDLPFGFGGVGAFNLIRRDAYERIGGHERLRMEVVDDLKLGRLVRQAGLRTRFFFGARDLEVEWGLTPRGMLKVLRKNHFAGLGYRTGLASAAIVLGTLVWLAGALGWTLGRPAGWAATAAWLLAIVPAWQFCRRHGWGVGPALAAPLASVLMFVSLANSMIATLREGGVRWRETFYPLAELREGVVR